MAKKEIAPKKTVLKPEKIELKPQKSTVLEQPKVKQPRIQTAEGWKRSQLRKHRSIKESKR